MSFVHIRWASKYQAKNWVPSADILLSPPPRVSVARCAIQPFSLGTHRTRQKLSNATSDLRAAAWSLAVCPRGRLFKFSLHRQLEFQAPRRDR